MGMGRNVFQRQRENRTRLPAPRRSSSSRQTLPAYLSGDHLLFLSGGERQDGKRGSLVWREHLGCCTICEYRAAVDTPGAFGVYSFDKEFFATGYRPVHRANEEGTLVA